MSYHSSSLPIAFILLFILCFNSNAQNNFVSTGTSASDSTLEVSYTIGQVFTNAFNTVNAIITEGVQQNFDLENLSVSEHQPTTLAIELYPNPTALVLNVKFKNTLTLPLQYKIIDLNGRLIFEGDFTSLNTTINLNVETAMYYLQIYKQDNFIKSFKVIKN